MLKEDKQHFETPPEGRMLEYVLKLTEEVPPPERAEWDATHVAASLNQLFDTHTVVEMTLIKSVIKLVLDDLKLQLLEQALDKDGVIIIDLGPLGGDA